VFITFAQRQTISGAQKCRPAVWAPYLQTSFFGSIPYLRLPPTRQTFCVRKPVLVFFAFSPSGVPRLDDCEPSPDQPKILIAMSSKHTQQDANSVRIDNCPPFFVDRFSNVILFCKLLFIDVFLPIIIAFISHLFFTFQYSSSSFLSYTHKWIVDILLFGLFDYSSFCVELFLGNLVTLLLDFTTTFHRVFSPDFN
jgi:hypothetical protein